MRSLLLTLGMLLLLPAWAGAESLLCPGGVISTGDRLFEVLEKCGEPTLRDRRTQGENIRVVEEWYIKVRGHERIFLFENGKLVKIILNP